MKNGIEELAYNWITANAKNVDASDYYCQTRDNFDVKLRAMINLFKKHINENNAYIISAIAGEIGNNSFDHNIGNWRDVMGVFFAAEISDKEIKICLADRGQGVFKTLKKVKPELKNDVEALKTAFTEKISGRAPENRGNGLKFVKENIKNKKMKLTFISGSAQAELNNEMEITKINKNIKGCLAIIKYKQYAN
ncbi:hypothetical protein KKH87_00430 [Patescibacteria group bacterium]|nr:hypothetical protein [Candidatus Falkowbacteria bacterium]MBU3905474.1 hypothetical protein [Patescibacteria group bacterium]